MAAELVVEDSGRKEDVEERLASESGGETSRDKIMRELANPPDLLENPPF